VPWKGTDVEVQVGVRLQTLHVLCLENIEYFFSKPMRSNKFLGLFQRLVRTLEALSPVAARLALAAPLYDLSPEFRANGYRSLISILIIVHFYKKISP
jgi:hypothetical protein